MHDDCAWLEVCALAKQSMERAQWEIAEPYMKNMSSAAERRAWLRVNAAPGVAMDRLLRELTRTLQNSMARAAAESRRAQRAGAR
jgi:hypothetical protein